MLFSFICEGYATTGGGLCATVYCFRSFTKNMPLPREGSAQLYTVCWFHFNDTNVGDFKEGPRATVCCFHSFAKDMPLPGEVSAQLYTVCWFHFNDTNVRDFKGRSLRNRMLFLLFTRPTSFNMY